MARRSRAAESPLRGHALRVAAVGQTTGLPPAYWISAPPSVLSPEFH